LKGTNWSSDFVDFVNKSLILDPDQRPDASEILKHPFMKKACNAAQFSPTIVEVCVLFI
jgi:serine/threonine-protein kinase 24/25/MST4